MRVRPFAASVGSLGMAAVLVASMALNTARVPVASAATVYCPNGHGQFAGTWSAVLPVVLEGDMDTTDVPVNGGISSDITFNLAAHTWSGWVYLSGYQPPAPDPRGFEAAGAYNCVTGSITGTIGGAPFVAAFVNNNTGIVQVSSKVLRYKNFQWVGGWVLNPPLQVDGTYLDSDPDDSGATAAEPEQVAVNSPTAGPMSVASANAPNVAIGGYYILAPTMHIVAPDASSDAPLALTFTIDGSLLAGQTPVLFRDAAQVPACATQPSATATPDPCVSTQTKLPNGDWVVVVLSSHASVWSVGRRAFKPQASRVTSAKPGNKQATVAWAVPASDGGAPITGYVVTPYLGKVAKPAQTFAKSAKNGVVKNLVNGKHYTFKVAAVNVMGRGALSTASTSVTVGAPSAPTAVKAARTSSGTLSISFGLPPSNGAKVTGYAVACTPASGGTTSATGTASPVRVSGLKAGTKYSCRVRATNSRGTGPASAASAKTQA